MINPHDPKALDQLGKDLAGVLLAQAKKELSGENVRLSFDLSTLEEILYRENAVIAAEDVPILLKVLCEESGQQTPIRITEEIRKAREERGD